MDLGVRAQAGQRIRAARLARTSPAEAVERLAEKSIDGRPGRRGIATGRNGLVRDHALQQGLVEPGAGQGPGLALPGLDQHLGAIERGGEGEQKAGENRRDGRKGKCPPEPRCIRTRSRRVRPRRAGLNRMPAIGEIRLRHHSCP